MSVYQGLMMAKHTQENLRANRKYHFIGKTENKQKNTQEQIIKYQFGIGNNGKQQNSWRKSTVGMILEQSRQMRSVPLKRVEREGEKKNENIRIEENERRRNEKGNFQNVKGRNKNCFRQLWYATRKNWMEKNLGVSNGE